MLRRPRSEDVSVTFGNLGYGEHGYSADTDVTIDTNFQWVASTILLA